jgi:hypothetical protein
MKTPSCFNRQNRFFSLVRFAQCRLTVAACYRDENLIPMARRRRRLQLHGFVRRCVRFFQFVPAIQNARKIVLR